jgi:cell division septation protein DedD
MADTAKPVETVPAAEPVVETKVEETPAAATTEAAAAETEATPVATETTEAPAAAEEAAPVEEKKPVEEGTLAHKGEGANFPKNFIYSKKLFWFGSEPVDLKSISTFKADKVADVAHHVTSWASETGKGLLFFGEKDKSAPQGAIHLADASEPVVDGNKFHFTAKGHKHTFKAATTTERDAWVEQLKAKIVEAKELAATVTESETYKKTLEALKPASKKEKTPEPVAAEPVADATEAAAEPAATEAPATEAPKDEEAKADEPAVEEPKRRSASRKRASIFGSFLGKKDEKKAEATAAATEAETTVAETSAAAETAATEAVAEAAAETAATTEAAEAKAEEKKEEVAEAVKPKRQSLFGNLSFGKKKVASPEPTPATEEAPATEAVAETAPVIPAVETTEPLSTEVTSPAAAPAETTEAAPATNGEPKKEVTEKRKSSLPFVGVFAKKEKATSGDEAEKPKSPSPFSKLRATIKGKKAEKVEKTEEPKAEETPAEAVETPAVAEEAPKPVEAEAAAPEEPAKPVTAVPVVTAAA